LLIVDSIYAFAFGCILYDRTTKNAVQDWTHDISDSRTRLTSGLGNNPPSLFQPCYLVSHFPVLHFPSPNFSFGYFLDIRPNME